MRLAVAVMLVWAGAAQAAPAVQVPSVQVRSVQVEGMVAHPGPVALDRLTQTDVTAKFATMHGVQAHTWRGPLLLDVVNTAGVKDEPGKKTHFRHTFLAWGADGYGVAIAMGEIDPKGEGKQVIVAVAEDSKPLDAPRLIVPGDHAFARGVRALTRVEVR